MYTWAVEVGMACRPKKETLMPLNHRHGGPFIESLCFFNAFHIIGIVAAEPGCFSNAFYTIDTVAPSGIQCVPRMVVGVPEVP